MKTPKKDSKFLEDKLKELQGIKEKMWECSDPAVGTLYAVQTAHIHRELLRRGFDDGSRYYEQAHKYLEVMQNRGFNYWDFTDYVI